MRRLLLIALVAAVAAPAAHASTTRTGFAFGRSGGNILPFRVEIATSGAVRVTGVAPSHRVRLTEAQLVGLNRAVYVDRFSTLPGSTSCPGVLPDIAWQFIRVGPRTVRVHGGCVASFNRLWTALSRATRAG